LNIFSSLGPEDLLMNLAEAALSMIPDEVLAIMELVSPETLSCNGTDDLICGQVDWLECNTDPDISMCMVPCSDSSDCAIEVDGTGLSICATNLTNYTADGYMGWCLPNFNGTCDVDTDCPSIIGYTCEDGTCRQPNYCDSDADCTDNPDGLKMCNNETYQCGPEFCSDSTDCISDGYVCQSEFVCVAGCDDVPCDDPLTCGDDGLCYVMELCEDDSDCVETFAPTCLNISVDLGSQGPGSICGATCDDDSDCDDIPWGMCMEGICLTSPNPSDIMNMTGITSCDDEDDCPEDMPVCVVPPMLDIGGMCVPDNASLILEMTGMTECDDDDDCTSSMMPICVDQTETVMGVSTCAPGCHEDNDCDDGWWCEELPVVGFGQCVTDNQCSLTGDTDDCDSDQVCVPTTGECADICDDDDDCSGNTPCNSLPGSSVISGLPVVGDFVDTDTVLFCDVFAMTDSPSPEPTEAPIEELGDAASEIMAFGSVIAMFTALLF